MNAPLSDDDIDRLARKRAKAKLGWYVHLLVFLVVNGVWFFASTQGLSRRPWAWYPALGWGLALVLHGVSVFLLGSGSAWRERMIERERDRLRHR